MTAQTERAERADKVRELSRRIAELDFAVSCERRRLAWLRTAQGAASGSREAVERERRALMENVDAMLFERRPLSRLRHNLLVEAAAASRCGAEP